MRLRLRNGILLAIGLVCVGFGVLVALVPGLRHAIDAAQPHRWQIAEAAFLYGIDTNHAVTTRMPDGTELAASLYLPKNASGPLPTVLVRLPYGRLEYGEGYAAGLFFARHGYAALVQDLRGTGDSNGEQLPWRDVANDGEATLDWIARQPWSNGKIGTFGCSALGETQLVLGARNHPGHIAIVASGAGGAIGSMQRRYGYFGLFEGGVFQLASGFGWYVDNGTKDQHAPKARAFDPAKVLRQLPSGALVQGLRPAPNGYTEMLQTPLGDPRWDSWGYLTDETRIRIPSLIINTWADQTAGDALVIAEHQRRNVPEAATNQRVVIAPGNHCHHEGTENIPVSGNPVGGETVAFHELYLRWFDYWLRGQGEGFAAMPAYTYYMLNEDRWYHASQWPPAQTTSQRWYLDSDGRANSREGSGVLAPAAPAKAAVDTFTYDPMNPVPTRGGPVCCTGDAKIVGGSVDQAEIESRDDVLVYTSQPLAEDLRIAGPLKATLTFSSDVRDTDLVLRLSDVSAEGVAMNIQEGALRLRYRDGAPAKLMEPQTSYQVVVDLRSIAYRFPRGHRLRLDVTSSSFPRLERNLNTGGANFDEVRGVVATNRLHHGPAEPSFLEIYALKAP